MGEEARTKVAPTQPKRAQQEGQTILAEKRYYRNGPRYPEEDRFNSNGGWGAEIREGWKE